VHSLSWNDGTTNGGEGATATFFQHGGGPVGFIRDGTRRGLSAWAIGERQKILLLFSTKKKRKILHKIERKQKKQE
jgi:hypothetical protein